MKDIHQRGKLKGYGPACVQSVLISAPLAALGWPYSSYSWSPAAGSEVDCRPSMSLFLVDLLATSPAPLLVHWWGPSPRRTPHAGNPPLLFFFHPFHSLKANTLSFWIFPKHHTPKHLICNLKFYLQLLKRPNGVTVLAIPLWGHRILIFGADSKLPNRVLDQSGVRTQWQQNGEVTHPILYSPLFCDRSGEYALAEYTEVKTVTIKLDDKSPWRRGGLLPQTFDSWMWPIELCRRKTAFPVFPGYFVLETLNLLDLNDFNSPLTLLFHWPMLCMWNRRPAQGWS